jgi:integrase
MDVRDVRKGHLVAMRDKWLAIPRDPSSVKTYLGRVVAFLRWLEEREIVASVPKMPKVEIPYKKRQWLNREGQYKILSYIAPRHQLPFELLIEQGIRQGEACALLVKDIVDGEVIIERALDSAGNEKGVKKSRDGEVIARYLPVSRELYAKLEAHARGRFGAEPLFRNRYGNAYRSKGLWLIWHEASIAAGLPISPREGTRHSKASQMRKRIEMANAISTQLGNTPAVAMAKYARPREEEVKEGRCQT